MQCVMILNIVYSVSGGDFALCKYLEFFKFQNRASNIIDEVTFRANDTLWNKAAVEVFTRRNGLQSIELVSASNTYQLREKYVDLHWHSSSGLRSRSRIIHGWQITLIIMIYKIGQSCRFKAAPTCFVQRRKQPGPQQHVSQQYHEQLQTVSSDQICKQILRNYIGNKKAADLTDCDLNLKLYSFYTYQFTIYLCQPMTCMYPVFLNFKTNALVRPAVDLVQRKDHLRETKKPGLNSRTDLDKYLGTQLNATANIFQLKLTKSAQPRLHYWSGSAEFIARRNYPDLEEVGSYDSLSALAAHQLTARRTLGRLNIRSSDADATITFQCVDGL
ncbi:Hypothetical_protein [Hexamita inflata]|nr:Hypothetical protein HINF_LOCUS21135 [Hexamita inflata]